MAKRKASTRALSSPTPEDYAFVDAELAKDPALAQRHTRESLARLRADARALAELVERTTPEQRASVLARMTPEQRKAFLIVEQHLREAARAP